MTNLITSHTIKGYEKAIEILKECNSIDDIDPIKNKLKEIENDYPDVKSIYDALEQVSSFKLDYLIPDLIQGIIEKINENIGKLRIVGENKFVNFLYSVISKAEFLRLLLFYSDLLILLHKSRREGASLLQFIKKGEETRDSLILKTELTFEKIDVEWILKEKAIEEKLEKMKELEVLLEKNLKNLIANQDFSLLGELLDNFEPLFTNIFGKNLNYEKYEKNKNLEWIERKIKENDKKKVQIDQFDNIEFFLNTTNQNLKTLTFFPLTIHCEACEKAYKIIIKLDRDEYIGDFFEDGYIGFPKDNIINCKCGHVINFSTIRNQIENATGKKLVTDYEDDKKLVGAITLEISCPKCGLESVLYGKFFRSLRIDKFWTEKGVIPIPKNNFFTCKCGLARWNLTNKIKELEQETGLKLKY
ncbi:MAG: hypothetical protein ACFFCM_01920 [Promethearchaeota archaeon]